ncbi:P-loop containing nucleoside triphosphate hydrolase protein [Mycena sanguinolenta]|nr:P-loop containing nucleoside triphosphate hydrolase protein [Mycena sanguinolenta]
MDTSPKTLRDYSKARLDILERLRDAGIEQEIEPPHMVVAGTQSAGKSSVLEAMSTSSSSYPAALEHAQGTCPMEFRLEHSPDSTSLSVQIALRFAGNNEVPFRSNLSELDEIQDAIREAQEQIVKHNCVCVFVKGPNMPDLYFYDLPGVIEAVPDGQDRGQIDLIKNLVKKYAAKPDCVVLLVVSCEYEIDISGAANIVTELGQEAKARTVGVLTKVDRIVEPMKQKWLATFNNQTHQLNHGWFAVKLPEEDDMSWEQARTEERKWFEAKEPWASIHGEGNSRLGSEKLTQYISKQLSNLVATRLPHISREITAIIKDFDDKLKRLPIDTERNAYDTVLTLIGKFSNDFSAHIKGIPPVTDARDVEIRHNSDSRGNWQKRQCISDGNMWIVRRHGIGHKEISKNTEPGLVYRVKQLYDEIRVGVSDHTPRFCPTNPPSGGSPPGNSPMWDQLSAKGEIVYLDTVQAYIKGAVTRELPGELPYGIIPRIIIHFVERWQDVAVTVFYNVKETAVDHFNALVREHFAEYERGGLLTSVEEILNINIDRCAASTVAQLKGLAAMELVPATVLKDEYIKLQTTIYQQHPPEPTPGPPREISPWSAAIDVFAAFLADKSAIIGAEIATDIISSGTRKILTENLAALGDPVVSAIDKDVDNALTVMASIQAYLELASKRFADVAANGIDHTFLRELDTRVCKALRALPANTSPKICFELLQDPAFVEERRRNTERRTHYIGVKKMLDDAMRDLQSDGPGHAESQKSGPDPLRSTSDSPGSHSSSPSLTDTDAPSDISSLD